MNRRLVFVLAIVLAVASLGAVLVLGLLALAVAPGGYYAAPDAGPAITYGLGAVAALAFALGALVAAWRAARGPARGDAT